MNPIFSRNEDIDKIAFLNWRIDENHIRSMLNMADGFMLSSIELSKHCLKNNRDKRADILIFPIFTNANHGIELYLKALNWMLNILLKDGKGIESRHNLKQLFQTVKAKVKLYKGNISYGNFKTATKELEEYINELCEKIESTPKNDKMDFSRYPVSHDNEDHFYVSLFGTVDVDLENLILVLETIRQKVDDLTAFIYYEELQQDFGDEFYD